MQDVDSITCSWVQSCWLAGWLAGLINQKSSSPVCSYKCSTRQIPCSILTHDPAAIKVAVRAGTMIATAAAAAAAAAVSEVQTTQTKALLTTSKLSAGNAASDAPVHLYAMASLSCPRFP